MADVPSPPVNEVVLSVALARQSALSGPLLPAVLGSWFESHPRVESAPPYEMPVETADPRAALQGPNVQLILAATAMSRYWLVSTDDQELIQVQPNYLALNWRHRSEESDYPGYDSMCGRFLDLLRTAEAGLRRHQGLLQPTRAELTYINVIHPDRIWSSHGETHKLLKGAPSIGAPYEQLSFSYSKVLRGNQDQFSGRLHVSLNPAVDWVKQEPQLALTLTARSADLEQPTIEASLDFLDQAHLAIEEAFQGLISDESRQAWGIG